MKPFFAKPWEPNMNEAERLAVARVKQANVKASDETILSWVRSVGVKSVMVSRLVDIRAVAGAF